MTDIVVDIDITDVQKTGEHYVVYQRVVPQPDRCSDVYDCWKWRTIPGGVVHHFDNNGMNKKLQSAILVSAAHPKINDRVMLVREAERRVNQDLSITKGFCVEGDATVVGRVVQYDVTHGWRMRLTLRSGRTPRE